MNYNVYKICKITLAINKIFLIVIGILIWKLLEMNAIHALMRFYIF